MLGHLFSENFCKKHIKHHIGKIMLSCFLIYMQAERIFYLCVCSEEEQSFLHYISSFYEIILKIGEFLV